MRIQRFATALLARDVAVTTSFYVDHFGFKLQMDIGWFTSMGHEDPAYELSVIGYDHETVPAEFQHAGTGFMGFIVEDAGAEEERLRGAGVRIVQSLADEPFGQRHFYCADPDGVLIDVIQLIPPDPEWVAANGLGGGS